MKTGQPYATWTEEEKARHREHQRRNSRKYRERAWAEQRPRTCEWCAGPMPPGKRGWTCSAECQRLRHCAKVRERKVRTTDAAQPMYLPRWCTECDREFLPRTGVQKTCGTKRCRRSRRNKVVQVRRAKARAD